MIESTRQWPTAARPKPTERLCRGKELALCPTMARDGSSAEEVMHRAAPCTCIKECWSGGVVFLGLFLLSLCLHAVTLVFYLDLRAEVRREIIHQKRDSVLTLAGSDLADPTVFLPGHPRLNSGSNLGGEERHEVKNKQTHLKVRFKIS